MDDHRIVETPVRRPNQIRRDAFFINPANREVMAANLEHGAFCIPHGGMISERTLAASTVTIVLTVVLWAFQLEIWIVSAVVGVVVTALLAATDNRTRAQDMMKRVREDGYITPGEVVQCVASTRNYSSWSRTDFMVKVQYLFVTPDEHVVQSEHEENRTDLSGKPLPLPGTPVYVLYFSDDEHCLL